MTYPTRPVRKFSTVFHIALWIAVAAHASACGARPDAGRADTAAGAAKKDAPAFRVALLTPGPISDQSWNAGAYRGLMEIRDSVGAQVSHIQTKTPAEFEENFRQYGAQGYDLVFGHGFEFQDAAVRVAPDFPKTVYITTSGNRTGANVAGMEFAFEEASYLAGMTAGRLTKSNVLGVIGGTELPPVKRSFAAFEAGARAVNPRIRVLSSFIGNWDDVNAGKEQALAQIGRGADVIFQNADAAGLGIFQAVRESKNVYVYGSNSDQNHLAPEVTVGSVVIDLPRAFLTVAREVKEKRFTPRVISLGMKEKVVQLVLNPARGELVSPQTRAAVDSVTRLIEDGRFALAGAGRDSASGTKGR
ncbi:MAG TPA: BMP family protein [Gemmatimonadaceae bacterium]|nr:BMP family protein [Gemmatimonadaceae bacterium]